MAMLLSQRWNRQPTRPTQLNQSNWFVRHGHLKACWLPNIGCNFVKELTTGVQATSTSLSEVANQAGRGISCSGSTSFLQTADAVPNRVTTQQLSVLTIIVPGVLTRGDLVTRWTNGAGAGDQFNLGYGLTSGKPQMFVAAGGGTTENSGVGGTAMSVGNTYSIGGSVLGTSSVNVYLNGILQASNTVSLTLINATPTTAYRLGDNASGNGSFTGSMYLAAVWDLSLTDAAFAELAFNPWQLFAPIMRRTYFLQPTVVASTGLLYVGSGDGAGGGIGAPAAGSAG